MKRKRKIKIIAATIRQEHFGQLIPEVAAIWLAEEILNALKTAKQTKGS